MILCFLSDGSPLLAEAQRLDPAAARCLVMEPTGEEPPEAVLARAGATATDQVLLDASLAPRFLRDLLSACRRGALGDVRILAGESFLEVEDIGFRARPWLRGIHRVDTTAGDRRGAATGAVPAPLSTVPNLARLVETWGPPPIRFDEVPCRFPPKLQIQTTTACSQNCSYCPKGALQGEVERMSEGLFSRLVEQCAAALPDAVELYFHAEPLEDERLERFASGLKDACPETLVSVITHEQSLDEERAAALGDSGLDVVFTSVNITGDAAAAALEARLDRVAALRDVLALGGTWLSVVTLANLAPPDTLAVFAAACRERGLPLERFKATTRLGEVRLERRATGPFQVGPICERPFTKSYIRCNGDVVLCCEDWRYDAVLGNLEEETIEEVWTGTASRAARRALLDGRPAGPCARCDYMDYLEEADA